MTDVKDLSEVRWEKIDTPAAHEPTAALNAAMRDIQDINPTHVIVVFGVDAEDGGSKTHYYQAGLYRHHAQQGLLQEAAMMIREGG